MKRPWAAPLLLFATYVAVARGSLELASVHISSSPVWPPAGLAIGALLVGGRRLWPAVLAGAFVANFWNSGHWESSALIAFGNTGEAWLGAYLMQRAGGSDWASKLPGVALFLAAAPAAASISAGVGIASLGLFGLAPWGTTPEIFVTWWLGNVSGILLVAPLLLTVRRFKRLDALSVLLGLTAALLAFQTTGLGLVLFIPVIFIALADHGRLHLSIFAIGAGSVFMTLHGAGPFWAGNANEALLMLQLFLISLAVGSLILVAGRTAEPGKPHTLAKAGAVSLTLAPLLIGALFVGTTLHPTVVQLHEQGSQEDLDRVASAWQDLIDEQGEQLSSLRAYMESGNVSTAGFAQFVETAGWQFGPGRSTAVGYAPLVTHEEKPAFESATRADMELPLAVREEFAIFPPTVETSAPVRFVYPMDPKPGAIGFDLFQNETRSQALLGSLESGRAVASPPVVIVRPEGNDLGMMIALPVQLGGKTVGFVISAQAIAGPEEAPFSTLHHYRVVDVTDEPTTLFSSGDATWSRSATISAWERVWRIDLNDEAIGTTTENAAPWFVLMTAGAMTGAVGLVVYAYDANRSRAESLSREIIGRYKRDEQRKADIRRLEDADEMRTRFLNMVAHELRTPLTPIRTQAHVLRNKVPPELVRSVEILERGALRLNQVVDDLLIAAKVDAGKLTISPQEIDLLHLAQEAANAHGESLPDGVQLEVSGDPTIALGDPDRVGQVLDNLLTNAIKFTEQGTIRIEVGRGHSPFLRVIDSGRGIPADVLPSLVRPFAQGQEHAGGTGLGLYICNALAKLQGGRFTLESEGSGKGTTATLHLPSPDA